MKLGSATFNILCVLAFCTLFSKTSLEITWLVATILYNFYILIYRWPLFRSKNVLTSNFLQLSIIITSCAKNYSRDIVFYTSALILLTLFFIDGEIVWYEAITLFTIYIFYSLFMKYNSQIETFVKKKLPISSPELEIQEPYRVPEQIRAEIEAKSAKNVKEFKRAETTPQLSAPNKYVPSEQSRQNLHHSIPVR